MAHEGHQGMVKTKQRIRSTMWFPGIDAAVEEAVAYCNSCQAATDTKQKEPLKTSSLPPQPWMNVNTDLFGPIDGGSEYVLLVQDTYSRYPVAEIIHSTSAKAVIPAMERTFAQFGVPEYVGSDNGPPYNSFEFEQFSKYMGFKHGPKIPLAPWTNGMVENFNHNLKKLLMTSKLQQANWRKELQTLLTAYRGTPHSTTGYSPAEVLFNGRQYRTRLPAMRSTEAPKFHGDIVKKDAARKEAMKTYADKKAYVKPSTLQIGDWVMYRQQQRRKSDTPYCGTPHQITAIQGNRVTAAYKGHSITRHSTFFKKVPNHPQVGLQPVANAGATVFDTDWDLPPPQWGVEEMSNLARGEEHLLNESIDTIPYSESVTDEWNVNEEYQGDVEENQEHRPRRERMQPAKLMDYQVNLPNSLS